MPLVLYNLLNYEALAYWIMCDGNKSGTGITLQTQSFTTLAFASAWGIGPLAFYQSRAKGKDQIKGKS